MVVESTNLVVREVVTFVPSEVHDAVIAVVKPLPLKVRVKEGPPAVTDCVDIVTVWAGAGQRTINVRTASRPNALRRTLKTAAASHGPRVEIRSKPSTAPRVAVIISISQTNALASQLLQLLRVYLTPPAGVGNRPRQSGSRMWLPG